MFVAVGVVVLGWVSAFINWALISDKPRIAHIILTFGVGLAIACGILYLGHITDLRRLDPRVAKGIWATLVVSVLTTVAASFSAAVKSEATGDEDKPKPTRLEGLLKTEFDRIATNRLYREGMKWRLEFREVLPTNDRAALVHHCEYTVCNDSEAPGEFVFTASFVAAAGWPKEAVNGVLEVRDENGDGIGGTRTLSFRRERAGNVFALEGAGGDDSAYRFAIPAHGKRTFRWSTDVIEVPLPYEDDWTSSHPSIGMSVDVTSSDERLQVVGMKMRRRKHDDDPAPHIPSRIRPHFDLTAQGLFLPSQGIFMRISLVEGN
jgi:hypothetical protein